MFRDITVVCALILAVAIGAFAGSAAAIHVLKVGQAEEMSALRQQVEPAVCRLFPESHP